MPFLNILIPCGEEKTQSSLQNVWRREAKGYKKEKDDERCFETERKADGSCRDAVGYSVTCIRELFVTGGRVGG